MHARASSERERERVSSENRSEKGRKGGKRLTQLVRKLWTVAGREAR